MKFYGIMPKFGGTITAHSNGVVRLRVTNHDIAASNGHLADCQSASNEWNSRPSTIAPLQRTICVTAATVDPVKSIAIPPVTDTPTIHQPHSKSVMVTVTLQCHRQWKW